MNHEIPDGQAGFRKDRGTRDQIASIYWIIKKAREFQKNTDPEMETASLASPALAGGFLTTGAPGKPNVAYISLFICQKSVESIKARVNSNMNYGFGW